MWTNDKKLVIKLSIENGQAYYEKVTKRKILKNTNLKYIE
jgi:hypothetical protein